jgi:beta-galactosidase
VTVDVVRPGADLTGYRLVVVPGLYLVADADATALDAAVASGTHALVTFYSGIVDEHDRVRPGGYPGAWRDLLGIRVEEFAPLLAGESVELDDATTGGLWSDRITVTDPRTEVLARYRTGVQAGRPAVTRRGTGSGSAAYVSTRLGVAGLTALLPRLLGPAGVDSELPAAVRGLVETTVRRGADARFVFLVNRTDETVTVSGMDGEVLLGTPDAEGALALAPRDVAVLRQAAGRGTSSGAGAR